MPDDSPAMLVCPKCGHKAPLSMADVYAKIVRELDGWDRKFDTAGAVASNILRELWVEMGVA